MPHPTLTWVATSLRNMAVAGTNSTVAECLTAVKAAIDNDSAYWETSAYSAGAYLELKRKASSSPTGEQATVRLLLFGGAIPNSAAIATGMTSSATNLYAAMSVTANTTGPTNLPTVGACYSVTYVPGLSVVGGAVVASAQSPKVSLVESVDGLGICFNDNVSSSTVVFGRLIEDLASDSLMWGIFPMCASISAITTADVLTATASNSPIPALNYSAVSPRGAMWNTTLGAARSVGRAISPNGNTGNVLGGNGIPTVLLPVPLMESALAASQAQSYIGQLRQLRFGPKAAHLSLLRNAGGVTQAIHFGPPNGSTSYGAWFDQVA